MAHLHKKPEWMKRKFRNHFAFEERIQQTKGDEENQSHHTTRLEFEEGRITARLFEAGLNAVDLLCLGFFSVGDGYASEFERKSEESKSGWTLLWEGPFGPSLCELSLLFFFFSIPLS